MSLELRPARPEEMERFAWVDAVGFGQNPTRERLDITLNGNLKPEQTLCAVDDGEIVSQMGVLPFRMRWNGVTIDAGGVTAVSTLPTDRRRGHLRKLMTRALAEMRDRGQSVGVLWASMAAIYQRYGFGLGFRNLHYSFDPRLLSYVDEGASPGKVSFIPLDAAAGRLAAVHRRYAAPRTLMLERSAEDWRWQFYYWPPEVVNLIAVYEERGEPLGYVFYNVHDDREQTESGPRQLVRAWEFVWTTPEAHRGIIRFLAGYDLAKRVEIGGVALDDPLAFQVQEPRLYGQRLRDGLWVRLVDLQQALSARGYAADGHLRIGIEDDLCPWNSGVWELEAARGQASVRQVQAPPDLVLSPRALASLASGCTSASALARAGMAQAEDIEALRRADRLFATAFAPLCIDGF
jgi:predicted acetyltransferase